MRRIAVLVIAMVAFALPVSAKTFAEMFPDMYAQIPEDNRARFDEMNLRQGKVFVGAAVATLEVPQDYYYLDAFDARFVLTEIWGNPENNTTLGMLFPVDASPLHNDSWGIEISFEEIGYVSDKDAAGYDYASLLKQMQADTREASKWRLENGYESIELVGWAAEPHYDTAERKLHWAQLLNFGSAEYNTLNYNIRALGRRGVLVLNFIADESQLPEIKGALPEVLSMVSFTEGNRYADFDPSIDTVAAVGIGGLIAGKVVAKTGLFAVALIFLKKFWFLALLPLIGLKTLVTGRRNS